VTGQRAAGERGWRRDNEELLGMMKGVRCMAQIVLKRCYISGRSDDKKASVGVPLG
jgi:hypothetical protein